jgi:hypothetical protein
LIRQREGKEEEKGGKGRKRETTIKLSDDKTKQTHNNNNHDIGTKSLRSGAILVYSNQVIGSMEESVLLTNISKISK